MDADVAYVFRRAAVRSMSVIVHLPKSVLCGSKSLTKESIMWGYCLNVRDAIRIAIDFDWRVQLNCF